MILSKVVYLRKYESMIYLITYVSSQEKKAPCQPVSTTVCAWKEPVDCPGSITMVRFIQHFCILIVYVCLPSPDKSCQSSVSFPHLLLRSSSLIVTRICLPTPSARLRNSSEIFKLIQLKGSGCECAVYAICLLLARSFLSRGTHHRKSRV